MRRCGLVLAFALMVSAVSGYIAAAALPPKISKPRPAPPTPPQIPPLPPAVIDNTLAVGGDDVKARKVDTRLSVDVHVNGRGPYRFIVDSGADTSAVGLRIARQLELPLGTPAILNGMAARNIVDRVKVAELTLGPGTIRNLELPALREVDLGGDGIIGIDALVHQRLMMDFEKRLIKVEDARVPVKYTPGEIVIIARRQRGQLILTEVRATGFRLDAVIDTGSEVTIGNSALRDKLIRKRRAKFWTVPMTDVTGVVLNIEMATIDELRLGPVTLRNVPIAFADVPPFQMFGLADEPALLLGTDILETFRRVSLDFRARKVRFQLKRCTSQGITISTSPDTVTRLSSSGGAEVCQA
ncbi:MAG: retroviral-like aspartic protease family protein [Pseudomonadota bacterium]